MKVVQTDVLIIGGRIAGCFAAINTSKNGKHVTILDKATLWRGGKRGAGNGSCIDGGSSERNYLQRSQRTCTSFTKKKLTGPIVA